MSEASLVISHAGAGSIGEALALKKSLVICVNETLMDNHQLELAEAVAEKNWCSYAVPETICDQLLKTDFFAFAQ